MTALCTEKDTLSALIVLRHTVPGEHPEISEVTAQVWHTSLALYPGEVVRHVALEWTGEQFPSREQFREAVADEQRRRIEAAADRALTATAGDDSRCPECDGSGFKLLSTDPVWACEPCPRGCEPPLPRHRVNQPRRRTVGSHGSPRRADYGKDVTDRMTGERATDGF